MMFQVLPNGTYGKQPPSRKGIEKLITDWLVRQARRKQKPGARGGVPVLALTTIGAKSGVTRTNPVGYVLDGDRWLITATAAGAKNHPAWYFNLAAHPEQVVIEVGGERIPVRATQLEGEELAAMTSKVMTEANAMTRRTLDRYRAATDREFPLIRLTRQGEPA